MQNSYMINELKNITRIDQDPKVIGKMGQHGWWVRFLKDGKKYHHFFNDTKYGGKESGLVAAQKFRDAIKKEHIEKEGETNVKIRGKATSRNRSGYLGVNRTSYYYTKRGKKYLAEVWQAHWPVGNGKFANTTFSIKKYGEVEAFEMALAAREQGVYKAQANNIHKYYAPKNVQQKIWRYLDFTKFFAMLDSNAIHFPSANLFLDKFEGSYSKKNVEYRGILNREHVENSINMEVLKREVGVSCWHANDHESAAMWELYSKSNESVCVQSTYEKLSNSLGERAELGLVQYIDYSEDFMPEHDPYLAFLYKRKSYEHESEVRALIKHLPESAFGSGVSISVNLEQLIEHVYISPTAPAWFHQLVENAVKRFGLNKPVIQSSLSEDPVY